MDLCAFRADDAGGGRSPPPHLMEVAVYGTCMIATLSPSTTVDAVRLASKRWLEERAPHVPGFISEQTLIGDDDSTIVMSVQFRSKADYLALADDPAQDAFWQESFAPLIQGEPRWIDGTWESTGSG
jgi:hypothetical protein